MTNAQRVRLRRRRPERPARAAAGVGQRDAPARSASARGRTPKLIATYHTHGPALAISKGLDRDRAVDESGNQVAVFGRRGGRPFNLEEMRRMYLRDGTGVDRHRHAAGAAGRRPTPPTVSRTDPRSALRPSHRSAAMALDGGRCSDADRDMLPDGTLVLDRAGRAARRARHADRRRRSVRDRRRVPRQGARPVGAGHRLRRPDEAHPRLRQGQADPARLRRRRPDAVSRRAARCVDAPAASAPIDKDEMCVQWKALYRELRRAGAGRRRDDRARARRRHLERRWRGTTTLKAEQNYRGAPRGAGVRPRRAAPPRHPRQRRRARVRPHRRRRTTSASRCA